MALNLFDDIQQRGFMKSPVWATANKQVRKAHEQSIVTLLPALRVADCYEITTNALALVIQLMQEKPSVLHPLYEHIALPEDRVWVEYDAVEFNTMRFNAGMLPTVQPEPTRLGFLFSGKANDQDAPISIRVFTLDQGASSLTDSAFEFRGNSPHNWPANQIRNVVQHSSVAATDAPRILAWGSYANKWQSDPVEQPHLRSLLDQGNMFYESHLVPYASSVPLSAGVGSLSIAAAIMNILHNRPTLSVSKRSVTSTFVSSVGAVKPFSVTVSTVGLKATPRSAIRRMMKRIFNRKPSLQHAVRSHWSYRKGKFDPKCNHYWVDTGKGTQQSCSHCGGLRWHRSASVRGNAQYGTKINTHTRVL
ncbi:hypothetical protein O9X80_11115 [Agrobacterium salinitolerans]|uniref:hypothetical protein n=1 Tax=Agrobacterium salinitolerans TaxID=1183413 RepID=UPI0022B81E4B|nr:hypothetical protein [Agrobacterium salinitolerans]MCZ7975037.1 hypothetical protein [Agrobacterium salinitolerans]